MDGPTPCPRYLRIVWHVPQRPHRPALYGDLTALIDAAGGTAAGSRDELAAATAAVVVQAGRTDVDGERFVALADRIGLETLAALWRNADPVSLPGALWALYALRQWCQTNPEEVARLWRAGEHLASADAVRRVADSVLSGAYRGDFGVALERAAALFRVVASGRRDLATPDEVGKLELERAQRNERVAADLGSAAARWRAGTLH